jgi:hypothetical protein
MAENGKKLVEDGRRWQKMAKDGKNLVENGRRWQKASRI